MTAQAFAGNSKIEPSPHTTVHVGGSVTGYTCHMAAMHWAFMTLGDTQQQANNRITRIIQTTCNGCLGTTPGMHGSINPQWYGKEFFFHIPATHILNRQSLYDGVSIGDVLIIPDPRMPMHTMVAVGKSALALLGTHYVYVRGYNNYGTLMTGIRDQYDDADRDIDKASLWRPNPNTVIGGELFGASSGSTLYVVAYEDFIEKARVVKDRS